MSFIVTTTPRARLELAIRLLHRDLKVKGRAAEKNLHRARRALGLIGISETLLANNYDLKENRYQHDNTTRHRFLVTGETAEWILKTIDPLESNTASPLFLESLLCQLEEQADAADANDVPLFDELAELPRWQPKYLADPPREDDSEEGTDEEEAPADEAPPPPPPPPEPTAHA